MNIFENQFNQEAKQDPILPRTIQYVLFIYLASAVVAKCDVHSYAVLWMHYKGFWNSHSFKHGVIIIYYKVLVLCEEMNLHTAWTGQVSE